MELLDKKVGEMTGAEFLTLKSLGKNRKKYTYNIKERGIDRYKQDDKLKTIIEHFYVIDHAETLCKASDILTKINEIYKTDSYRLGVQLNKMGYKGKTKRVGTTTGRFYNVRLK